MNPDPFEQAEEVRRQNKAILDAEEATYRKALREATEKVMKAIRTVYHQPDHVFQPYTDSERHGCVRCYRPKHEHPIA